MKFSVLELRKTKLPITQTSEIDFSKELNGFEDIISSEMCKVSETISRNDGFYSVDATISIKLTLESAISLKEVPYEINTRTTFLFTENKEDVEDSDAILIENGEIDTFDAILTEILCNKPMTISLPGEEYKSEESEEESINPAFASLADLLKK